jgi:transposase
MVLEEVGMEARMIWGDSRQVRQVKRMQHAARHDGAYLVAQRLHAVRLSMEGYTAPQIGSVLGMHRSNVSLWLRRWQEEGLEGVLAEPRSGRPSRLGSEERRHLDELIDSGPIAYGFLSGVWTAPMVAQLIAEVFGVWYHPGHVRKLLRALGFSLQRPGRLLIRANPREQERWERHTYPGLKKKPGTGGRRCSSPMRPAFDKTPAFTAPGRAGASGP